MQSVLMLNMPLPFGIKGLIEGAKNVSHLLALYTSFTGQALLPEVWPPWRSLIEL